jgi:ABC-type polysaccharide/polyol phosphate export permease
MNYAIKDIIDSFNKLPMAIFFAWGDTVARYRRSILGPFWLVLGTAIGTLGLGLLWGKLLKVDYSIFIPSLTVGLVVWQLIAGSIVEGSTSFIRNSSLIRNVKTPYLIFPVQVLLRQLINFAHNLIVVVGVLIVFSTSVSWVTLLVIPNLLLVVVNLLWMMLLIGMLGARFRDMEQLVAAIMPLLFFLSPVIYRPDQLGIKAVYVWINPFSHMISLLRFPLQGAITPSFVYVVMIAMMIAGWSLSLWLLNRKYGRIAFWV